MNGAITEVGPRIRSLREARRLGVGDLARRSGYSAGFISQIENGTSVPSLSALAKIADALSLPVHDFFPPPPEGPKVLVSRADDPDRLRVSPTAHDEFTVLNGRGRGAAFTALVQRVLPKSPEEVERQAGERFALLLDGSASLSINGRSYELQSGDMVHYDSQVPHAFDVTSDGSTEIFWLVMPPLFS